MYKTTETIIPANSNFSNEVVLPGKLVGVILAVGGTAADITVEINTPLGWATIVVNSANWGTLGRTGNCYLGVTWLSPVGTTTYRVRVSTTDTVNRAIAFAYDDMPNLL